MDSNYGVNSNNGVDSNYGVNPRMGPRGVVGVSCIFPESETSYLLLMKDTRNEVGINNGVISNTGVDLANVVNSNDGVARRGGSYL